MSRVNYAGRVLKSVIYHPDLLYLVVSSLSDRYFDEADYRAAWRVLRSAAARSDHLSNTDLIDALTEANIDPSTLTNTGDEVIYNEANIDNAINELKSRWQLVQLNRAHKEWVDDTGKVATDVSRHIATVMDTLHQLQSDTITSTHISSLEATRVKMQEQKKKHGEAPLLGFPTIDFIVNMSPQQLWVIGGYTSVGKSWLGIQALKQNIARGVPSLWVSLEMSSEQMLNRLYAMSLDKQSCTVQGIATGTLDEPDTKRLDRTINAYSKKPLYSVDYLTDWTDIRAACLYHIYAKDVRCIVIDYLQNITVEGSKSEYDTLNRVARELQRVAVAHDCFVLALSQMSREAVKTGDQRVFGYRGSSSIENAADVAMVLRLNDEAKDLRMLSIGKNRNGTLTQSDVAIKVDYDFGHLQEVSYAPAPK